ncbi:FtsK/SpoIIIE domain-containing protein [Nocardia asiatica]|uniref:FtsK/SpoIIIE domain-containing protein n=1 Tax=Nocardia asiatica TaxID=209252 RepID=UPI0012FCF336|nr:FtsK/SpoIIIE domain-containing protein [Nocardia asiatica]
MKPTIPLPTSTVVTRLAVTVAGGAAVNAFIPVLASPVTGALGALMAICAAGGYHAISSGLATPEDIESGTAAQQQVERMAELYSYDPVAATAVNFLLQPAFARDTWCGLTLGSKTDGIWPTLEPGTEYDGLEPGKPDPGFIITPQGARVRLRTPHPYTNPSLYFSALPALANSLGVDDIAIVKHRNGILTLDLVTRNPLSDTVPLPLPEEPPNLQALDVGRRVDGGEFRMQIRGTHLLLAGLTGAGKSSGLWSIIAGLAPSVRDGLVQLHVIDLKRGQEMAAGYRLFTNFAYLIPDALMLLQDLVHKVLHTRADAAREEGMRTGIGDRKHSPTREAPHHVVIIDEVMALLLIPGKSATVDIIDENGEPKSVKVIEYATQLLIELLTQARSVGITIVMATQNAAKAVFDLLRDLVPSRAGMRMPSSEQETMMFGHGARERGARCTEIGIDEAGTVYVETEDDITIRRARFYYVGKEQIKALGDYYAPPGAEHRHSRPIAGHEEKNTAPPEHDDEHKETSAADGGKIVPFRHPERGGNKTKRTPADFRPPRTAGGMGGKPSALVRRARTS